MMPPRIQLRSAWLGFTALLGAMFVLAFAATLQAQVLNDPRVAEFDPSPDHCAVLDSGQLAVLPYELDVYPVGRSAPFGTLDMGTPSPQGDGKIRYDFASQIASLSLPGGNGTGNGTVAFVVKPNNAASVRTAKLTIGPWVVAVQQAGKPRRTN